MHFRWLCSYAPAATPTQTLIKDDPKLTPLMNAAAHNDLPRVRTLLAQGANVKATTAEGQTALYEAIDGTDLNANNLPIVDAPLEAGADTNEVEFLTSHPLNVSLTRDYANPSVTLRLLQRGAHVPQECPPQNAEDSLVSLATQESSIDVIRELIVRGSPVNCQFKGETALHWAALNGQYDRVELLLDSGADPRQRDLDAAIATNPIPTCKVISRRLANFSKKHSGNRTDNEKRRSS